jgi:stress response protein YsnF
MAPLDIDTALEWRGRTVVDRDGDKIGKLEELYLDESDRPAWGAVTTGLFGRRQSFVPLSDLRAAGDDLQVPYEKDRVKDAPNVDPDEQLSGEEEERLHRHYGMATGDADLDAGEAQTAAGGRSEGTERAEPTAATGGAEAAGATAGERDADDGRAPVSGEGAEMIRSEEEVSIGTRRQATHRARLKKYVVTEHVKQVVPVQREEVRVEYEPAEGEDAARDQPAREDVVHDDAERDDAARDEPARDERGRGD